MHTRVPAAHFYSAPRCLSVRCLARQVPLSSTVSRPLALSTLADDSIHVLVSNYLCLNSYFPRSVGGYHKYVTIDLEDFLPMYEIDEETVQMISMPHLQQLIIFAPSHNMLLVVGFEKTDATVEEAAKAGAQPLPRCTVSVVALQPPNSNSQSFTPNTPSSVDRA
jgi:hypothetical protein